MEALDLLVVGAGPAGLSAAITARRRNKTVLVVGKEETSSKLTRAHRIENYPGLPGITGAELAARLRSHAQEAGAVFSLDEVQGITMEEGLYRAFGRKETYTARTVVLAPGASQHASIPGEEEFLGRGVSYCATCDGMIYRGRRVAVIGYLPEALAEALFLKEIGAEIVYLPQYRLPETPPGVRVIRAKPLAVLGEETVKLLRTDQGDLEVEGVFIEREALPADALLPDLALDEGFIRVDRFQRTNLPGVFAAGDCTGKPWQLARAVGEGQVAALSAVDFLAGS
ncbi:MAG: FAD-dependent oxidoreductase [Firmicutes bacterium]|nr:FAD-dependent oxidoreductase [Bacillota bacterium]